MKLKKLLLKRLSEKEKRILLFKKFEGDKRRNTNESTCQSISQQGLEIDDIVYLGKGIELIVGYVHSFIPRDDYRVVCKYIIRGEIYTECYHSYCISLKRKKINNELLAKLYRFDLFQQININNNMNNYKIIISKNVMVLIELYLKKI